MSCPPEESLSALVDGEASANQAAELEQHLAGCETCRATRARLEKLRASLGTLELAPASEAFVQRVAKGLEGKPRRSPVLQLGLALAGAAALGAVAFIAATTLSSSTRDTDFSMRGGDAGREAHVGFEAYAWRGKSERRLLSAAQRVPVGAGYSFVVYNRSGAPTYLALFGVDAGGEVHWFYPAFPTAEADPESITVAGSPSVFNLPDGVTPEAPAAGRFEVVAVFTPAPVKARALEAAAKQKALEQQFPDAVIQRLPLVLEETP